MPDGTWVSRTDFITPVPFTDDDLYDPPQDTDHCAYTNLQSGLDDDYVEPMSCYESEIESAVCGIELSKTELQLCDDGVTI